VGSTSRGHRIDARFPRWKTFVTQSLPRAPLARLQQALRSADYDAAVDILDSRWAELLSEHPAELAQAVSALPTATLQANPRWAMAITYLDRMQTPGDARTLRVNAPVDLSGGTGLLDVLADLTSRGASRRAAGDFAGALALADEAHARLTGAGEAAVTTLAVALSEFHYQWGMTRELAGDFIGAAREYTAAFEFARATRHTVMQASAAAAIAWTHAIGGRVAAAEHWLGQLPPNSTEEWWASRFTLPALYARVLVAADRLDFDEAAAALALADVRKSPERWAGYVFVRATLVQHQRNARTQLSAIDARVAELPVEVISRGANLAFLTIARASLFAFMGQLDAAKGIIDAYSPVSSKLDALVQIIDARVSLLRMDLPDAEVKADAVLSSGVTAARVVSAALMLQAASSANIAKAVRSAEEALEIAEANSLVLNLSLAPRERLEPIFSRVDERFRALADRVLQASPSRPLAARFETLTRRERAVVEETLRSTSIGDIAERLFVSPNTIKSQLRSIYKKIGVANRDELRAAAIESGLGG
jgi:DNA-binding NarL/FixJ family response regulator